MPLQARGEAPPMGAGLQVRVQAGSLPAGLEALSATASGCFFQHPLWLQAVRRAEPRLRPFVLTAERDGTLVAALPFLAVQRFGTLRLHAGAWGTYGGIVAREAAAAAALRQRLEVLRRSPRLLLVRVHDFAGSLTDGAAAGAPAWRQRPETCQVLDLPADPETLFRDAFTMQNRNKIRKAEKHGVTVRRARDAAALAAYAALYRESAARWGIEPRLPEAFFAALAQAPTGVDVWLAEQNGAAVAALLNFTWGGQVMNWGNVSRRDAWGASPNNLLHWRALQAACLDRGGPRLYNFGSSAGLPGVETFKSSFGARPLAYLCHEHVAAWIAPWRRRGAPA